MSVEGQPDITICSPDCPTRLRVAANPQLTQRMISACEAAATILICEGMEIGDCPITEFTEHMLQ